MKRLILLLTLAGMLAACGPSGSSSAPSTDTGSSAAPTVAAPSVEASPSAS